MPELGSVYLFTRRYDESIAQYQKALDLNPNLPVIRAELSWAYAMKHMYPQALAEYDKIADQDKAVAAENQFVAGGLGWVYAVSGRRADALRIAKEFKDLSSHSLCRFLSIRLVYAGLGDKDEAFRLLEKGYKEHSAAMVYLGETSLGTGCAPTLATPTCCAEWGCLSPSDPLLVKRYTGRTSKIRKFSG